MQLSAEQIIGVILALVGGIVALYRSFCQRAKESENLAMDRWARCEEEHKATRVELTSLREDLTEVKVKSSYLEGRQDGITALSNQVLEEISKQRNDDTQDS